jgi:hypothetical protein
MMPTMTLIALLAAALGIACDAGPAKAPAAAAQAAAPSGSPPAIAPTTSGAAGGVIITGSVAEAMNSGGYTYVRMQTGKDDVWIAATEFAVQVGERLTVPLEMPMQDFHSKTLNRDFPLIYFVSQVSREGQTRASPHGPPAAPAMMGSRQSADAAAVAERIPPAPGGLSIADVWAKRASLAGRPVVVRGKVVKVNNGIMDRNWFHLQDGSGSAAERTNDLTATTDAQVKVGDIVTASGILAVSKDFGSGYAYDAILEKATVTVK